MKKINKIKLSIIIVNYNVKFFLEQCLKSVQIAIKNINCEIIVVDNNSVDKSNEMIEKLFPWVILIKNDINLGYSKANNQGIKISNGEYILLLNPDTLINHDTLTKSLSFISKIKNSGGLGVKMIDGNGSYLKESKRSLPTPLIAFYKIFGLSRLFPKSKIFGKYHMSYLDIDKVNEVEILCGAFMMIRRKALEKIGLLDEIFFMYGEDIDLSYRLHKNGFKNFYYPKTSIIHYKGESTKKTSLNYVYVFYNAMKLFSKKHFSNKKNSLMIIMINFAIYFRAMLSIISRFYKKIYLKIFDYTFFLILIFSLINFWESNLRYVSGGAYPNLFINTMVPLYGIICIISHIFSNSYKQKIKYSSIFFGCFYSIILLLIFYSLLSENYRFSRFITLMSGIIFSVILVLNRIIMKKLKINNFSWYNEKKNILILGSIKECKRVDSILINYNIKTDIVKYISNEFSNDEKYIGAVNKISEACEIYKIDEVIFCSKDISSSKIIEIMIRIKNYNIEFKIAPNHSEYIIGSNTIISQNEIYNFDYNNINLFKNKFQKKIFDIIFSLFLLIFYPIIIKFSNCEEIKIKKIISILTGKKTWVSYNKSVEVKNLPFLKDGIFSSSSHLNNCSDINLMKRLNNIYAKDYSIMNDFYIILKNIFKFK